MRGAAIGTILGLKRRRLGDDRQSQLAHHVIEHVIVEIAHIPCADLERHVAIAQVVSNPQ